MTPVYTIDGEVIDAGDRLWYQGCKNVHASNDTMGTPYWRSHPAMFVTVTEIHISAGGIEHGHLVVHFDKPLADYPSSVPCQSVWIGIFKAKDGRLYAGHYNRHDFDGFVEPCNFFGLYSSKEAVGKTKWPNI